MAKSDSKDYLKEKRRNNNLKRIIKRKIEKREGRIDLEEELEDSSEDLTF